MQWKYSTTLSTYPVTKRRKENGKPALELQYLVVFVLMVDYAPENLDECNSANKKYPSPSGKIYELNV